MKNDAGRQEKIVKKIDILVYNKNYPAFAKIQDAKKGRKIRIIRQKSGGCLKFYVTNRKLLCYNTQNVHPLAINTTHGLPRSEKKQTMCNRKTRWNNERSSNNESVLQAC